MRSNEDHECRDYCQAEDKQIAAEIALSGDYEENVLGMVNQLLERYKGGDLGVPNTLIGVVLRVTNEGTVLDQALYTKVICKKTAHVPGGNDERGYFLTRSRT